MDANFAGAQSAPVILALALERYGHHSMWNDKSKIVTGFTRAGFVIEFDALERHCNFMISALDRELSEFEQEIEKHIADKDDEYINGYRDAMTDEHWHISEVFPRVQWYAQFLVAYSVFEKSLNELCKIVQNRYDFDLSLKDLTGQGITRARNYLVKVAGVDTPFNRQEWSEAKFFADVRNAIAHRNGEIEYTPGRQGSLSARIESSNNIKLKRIIEDQEDAEIVIDGECVLGAIRTFRKIVMNVCNFQLYKG